MQTWNPPVRSTNTGDSLNDLYPSPTFEERRIMAKLDAIDFKLNAILKLIEPK